MRGLPVLMYHLSRKQNMIMQYVNYLYVYLPAVDRYTDMYRYRPIYRLSADISVLPIQKMLIGIGYRYRPIRRPISVVPPIRDIGQNYIRKFRKKLVWQNNFHVKVQNFALLKYFMKYNLKVSEKFSAAFSKKFTIIIISTYRYRHRYRPIRKKIYRYFIGIGR